MNLTSLLRSTAFIIFLLLSTYFIPSSLAQLDVTKFSKTLSTLARDGLGTATLQVSHLPNTESFPRSLQVHLHFTVEVLLHTDAVIVTDSFLCPREKHLQFSKFNPREDLFTWGWGTQGRWGYPPVQSLILISSRLHDRWGDLPHVTSPIWGPPPPCKRPSIYVENGHLFLSTPVNCVQNLSVFKMRMINI